MATIILAVGLVLCIEGLVFALAPSRLEDVLDMLRKMSPESRRMAGLGALAVGVFLVWLAKTIGH
ncbi:MAG: DUF2065 domain-containing protein [Marinosulfonomonas sp.]|nr:DUF2065 domain-containing protein [Marinosulfonomonas sp.]